MLAADLRDMLLADLATDSILRFDGETGAPLGAFVSSGSGGLVNPHNPTFGPDGNLYVFSTQAGAQKILEYNGNTGAFVGTFINTGVGGFAGGFGMAFGPNGDLYVATGGANVLRYNGATGAFVGIAATGNGIIRASGVEFGPDGNLYVLDSDLFIDTDYDRILRFDADTAAFIDVFVKPGSLEDSIAFAFGPDGHIYVPDNKLDQSRSFNGTTGEFQGVFTSDPSVAVSFAFDLVWGPDGNAYAPTAERILRFEGETGEFIDPFVEGAGGSIVFLPAAGDPSDLAITIDSFPPGAFIGEEVSITYTVTNNSVNATAVDEWVDVLYWSEDEVFDPFDVEIGRMVRTGGLGGGASYARTLTVETPILATGEYHVLAFTDRRGQVPDVARQNNLFAAADTMQVSRVAQIADPTASIAVGRTLSSWTTADVIGNELIITYTVYNLQADPVQGALLTTTLEPNVNLKSASLPPNQNGQELAWNVGTIAPHGRVSIDVTVSFDGTIPLQLDNGAAAIGTVNTILVSDGAPAATLRSDLVDANLIAATPDADSTDPFIQQKAAELDYDPNAFFQFLADDVAYQSYYGSLRGARGTLWSSAGNSLDVASLGIALLRASGIPAQYAQGTLPDGLAHELILSMFPEDFEVIGHLDPGTETADPLNDLQLLAETRDHYWLQFDAGGGMQDADPLIEGASVGQSFALVTSTFAEVADAVRAKTQFALIAEITNSATSLFGISGASETTVLDITINDVELVGRPLTFGQFVNQSGFGALFSAVTNTYSPYLSLGNDAFPDANQNEFIVGTDYQEVLTNFPFGSQILTGLFLEVTMSEPQASGSVRSATVEKTLLDRVGVVARQGGGGVPLQLPTDGAPALTPLDIVTLHVSTSSQSFAGLLARENQHLIDDAELVSRLRGVGSLTNGVGDPLLDQLGRQLAANSTALVAGSFAVVSDMLVERNAQVGNVAFYFDSPRLVAVSSGMEVDPDSASATNNLTIDILRAKPRVVLPPGQAMAAAEVTRELQGFHDSLAEGAILNPADPLDTTAGTNSSFAILVRALQQPGVSPVVISQDNLSTLDSLYLTAEAKTRIMLAAIRGDRILVPSQSVIINGEPRIAWLEKDAEGYTIAVSDDGNHAGQSSETGGLWAAIQDFFAIVKELALKGWQKIVSKKGPEVLEESAKNPRLVGRLGSTLGVIALSLYEFSDRSQFNYMTGQDSGRANAKKDPPIGGQLFGDFPAPSVPTNDATTTIDQNSNLTVGAINGTTATDSVSIAGSVAAAWNSTAATAFQASTLHVANATVLSELGQVIGSGVVALVPSAQVPIVVSGNNQYNVDGNGRLAFYDDPIGGLGVSSEWKNYSALVTGSLSIAVSTAALRLNGTTLPEGTYTVTTITSATISGSGASASPSFAGDAQIDVTSGQLELGSASGGNVSLGGNLLNLASGITLHQFTGTVNVAANGNTDVTLTGNVAAAVSLSATPPVQATDQNTYVDFQTNVRTSFAGPYRLSALAPPGWMVTVDNNGLVSVKPQAGLQSGTFPVQLLAQSATNPKLVAQTQVEVTVNATSPGISLQLVADPTFSVPVFGAQLPSAFLATIYNSGPTTDTIDLTFPNPPDGFTILSSANTVTIPPGRTATIGIYLGPDGQLPPPGTQVEFTVAATSSTNAAITESQVRTFVVPAVHAITLDADPPEVTTTPGLQIQTVLVVEARGNVPDTVDFTVYAPPGLTVDGIQQLTLNPGELQVLFVTLTPDAGTPLNSALSARIEATFGGLEPVDFTIPVHVAAPGVESVNRAAAASRVFGNEDLANRLDDLGIALTNLTQQPGSEVFKSQALASLDSILTLLAVDPILVNFIDDLTGPRDELAAATNDAEVLTALNHLGTALDGFGDAVFFRNEFNFELFLLPNTQVALPQVPTQYELKLHHIGGVSPGTYNISLSGLPPSVTSQLSDTQVTLNRDEFASVFVTLTQNDLNELLAFDFAVDVSVESFPEIAKSAVGSMTVRNEFVGVVDVAPDPPFTDPGTMVGVTTRLLNAVNRRQDALVSFEVFAPNGDSVFVSTPVNTELTVQTSLTTVDLGTFDTTGLALGNYRIVVTVTDALGVAIPGATGEGLLLIGSPVTASLDVAPQTLPPGDSTVTNTLQVSANTAQTPPFALVGVAAAAGATGLAVSGNLAYVAIPNVGIRMFDITDRTDPQFIRTVGTGAGVLQIRGDKLVALRNPIGTGNTITLSIYSLAADPANPTLLGTSPNLPYWAPFNLLLTDTHAYLPTLQFLFFGTSPNANIVSHSGDLISIDISNPSAPTFADILVNTFGTSNDGVGVVGGIDQSGGPFNVFDVEQVDASTLYIATTTATGGDPQLGVGRIRIIDIANPANLSIAGELQIPGTVQITGIQIDGDRAYVLASSGGWTEPDLERGLAGSIVLATLDISDPRDPQILDTQTLSRRSRGIGATFERIAEDLYSFGSLGDPDDPEIGLVNTADPLNLVSVGTDVTALPNMLAGGDGFIYSADSAGLKIYEIGEVSAIPVTAQVQIPNFTGVEIVPGSFNIEPTEIIAGVGFDTLVWELGLTAATPTQTFTWQTSVTGLQPGERRAVTFDTFVDFTVEATPGQVNLPPESVIAEQVLSLDPATQTKRPGESAIYTVTIENPAATDVIYDLSVAGVPLDWVNLPTPLFVAAGTSASVDLTLTSDPFAALSEFGFVVTATTAGVASSVEGALVLAGDPLLPAADPIANGVVVSVTPVTATAGQGTAANYVARVTNTGSAADDFVLFATGLPASFVVAFDSGIFTVPPGASNFREFPFTIVPPIGTTAANYPFTVTAASITDVSITGDDDGSLTVLSLGVAVNITQTSGPPGSVFQMVVTNTGQATETFDLALAAPVALVATLGSSSVTLNPGASQTVPITVGAIDFAFPGALQLVGIARSRTNNAVLDSDSADVTIAGTKDVAAAFEKELIELPVPGPGSFLLLVENIGNLEDQYTATISTMTGPASASLVGLDGKPTQTVPLFILPGLSTGAILLSANLANMGTGTVTVQVTSLTNGAIAAEATATLRTPSEEPDALCLPTIDFETDAHGNSLPAGAKVFEQWAAWGVHVTSHDPFNNPPMIINTAITNPNEDLKTPGPGLNNTQPLRNALVISKNRAAANGSVRATEGVITFTFDTPVELHEVHLLDVDPEETDTAIRAFDSSGNLVASDLTLALGNNSVQIVALNAVNVARLEITFDGNSAVTDLIFCRGGETNVSRIGDTVFDDADGNGIQGPNERGVAGVVMELLAGGQLVGSVTTDSAGGYGFTAIDGDYAVRVAGRNFQEGAALYQATATNANPQATQIASADDLSLDFAFDVPDIPPPGTSRLIDDPVNPGAKALYVVGTIANNKMLVEAVGSQLRVKQDGKVTGSYPTAQVGRIVMLGLDGGDTLEVKSNINIRAELRGGPGNDTLNGGAAADEIWGGTGYDKGYGRGGNDLLHGDAHGDTLYGDDGNDTLYGDADRDTLYGGAGHDLLRGGDGMDKLYGEAGNDILLGDTGDDLIYGGLARDILIGGLGRDELNGDQGDDLLVGGTTAHDTQDLALKKLLAEWISSRLYGERVANLRAGTGPILGGTGITLVKGASVLDDGAGDMLQGGLDLDWFFYLLGEDPLKDKASNELVN